MSLRGQSLYLALSIMLEGYEGNGGHITRKQVERLQGERLVPSRRVTTLAGSKRG